MSFYNRILSEAVKHCSIEFGRVVTVGDIKANSRARLFGRPRWFSMAYMHAIGEYSLTQIAEAHNLRNHTSVLHGLRRAHGYDGVPVFSTRGGKPFKLEPLWTKKKFEGLVYRDGFTSQQIVSPDYESLISIGTRNLSDMMERAA